MINWTPIYILNSFEIKKLVISFFFYINATMFFCLFLSLLVFFSKSGGNSSSSVEDEVSASIRPLISSAGENIGQGGEKGVNNPPASLQPNTLNLKSHR